jgi:hypothetical protein
MPFGPITAHTRYLERWNPHRELVQNVTIGIPLVHTGGSRRM